MAQTMRAFYQPQSTSNITDDAAPHVHPTRRSLLFPITASLALWALMILTTWSLIE